MTRKRRTWASFQDEKAIAEANARKAARSEQEKLEEEMKKHGNIKEAAAVFSQEGFRFLLDGLGGYVAKRLQPELEKILDRKLGELLEGMKEGAQQALIEFQQASPVKVKEALGNNPKPRVTPEPSGDSERDPVNLHKRWSTKEDIYLADTVLRYVREGGTQLDAVKIVAEGTGRTVSAVEYRWHSVVKKRYKDELQEALRERRRNRTNA